LFQEEKEGGLKPFSFSPKEFLGRRLFYKD